MSHQEQATLEYAQTCNEMLSESEERLREIMEASQALADGSRTLMDSTLQSMMDDLRKTADSMMQSMKEYRGSIGTTAYAQQVSQTKSFLYSVNETVMKADALNSAIKTEFDRKMNDRSVRIPGLEEYMESVQDDRLRRMMILLSRNPEHSVLTSEELQELAESKLDPSKKISRKLAEQSVARICSRMAEEKLSADVIERVTASDNDVSPLEMMNRATEEIMDERFRRSAIQAIVKSIISRGFVVRKENIRYVRETDTVKITAMKPGGQKAEFSVDLNGKFMYHFQGYEGQACQKDIAPLEKDLEEVYGIKLTDRKTIWDNPDKLKKSHQKEMKVRRDS